MVVTTHMMLILESSKVILSEHECRLVHELTSYLSVASLVELESDADCVCIHVSEARTEL
jgi:hypothetical protein